MYSNTKDRYNINACNTNLWNNFSLKLTSSPAPPPLFIYFSAPQVQFPDGKRTLCLIPARFHKKLWIKRGNYLIIENVEETDAAVTGQVIQVLFTDHVKQLKKIGGVWPIEFSERNSTSATNSSANLESANSAAAELEQLNINGGAERKEKSSSGEPAEETAASLALENNIVGPEESYSSSDDDLPPIVKIQNRRVVDYQLSETDSESENGEQDEDEDGHRPE